MFQPIDDQQTDNRNATVAKGAACEAAVRTTRATDALRDMSERMQEVSNAYQTTGVERTAGRVAEEWHAGTFNAAAAAKGRPDLAARTTAAAGAPTAKADLRVTRNGKVIAEAQSKYTRSAAKTTFELSDPAFDGMQKLHPADQDVAGLARRRGASGTGRRNFPDTAKNATDRVRAKGVKSKPLTRQQALDAAQHPAAAAGSEQLRQTLRGAQQAAAVGGAVRGGLSALANGKAVWNGDKELGEAVVDVAVETGKGAAEGAAIALGAEAIKQGLTRAGARSLARGSAPVAVAMTVLDVGKDAVDLLRGDIDGEEFAVKSAKNVAKGGATWGGAEVGAALGTLIWPGPGTVVLGILGAIGGALTGGGLFD